MERTGKAYHTYNAAKLRILHSVFNLLLEHKSGVTVEQIAEHSGLPKGHISRLLSRWHNKKFGYLKRLPKRNAGGGAYKYKMNKTGLNTYNELMKRAHLGQPLNLRIKPDETRENLLYKPDFTLKASELNRYIELSRRGDAEGLTDYQKLEAAGVIRI